MTLHPEDGKLFFELMWKAQFYVNQKRGFHKNISSMKEYADLATEEKAHSSRRVMEIPRAD